MSTFPEAATHEEGFVNTFVAKDYRKRLLFEMQKRRGHFLGRFSHRALDHLDARFVVPIPPPNSDPAKILQLLKARGAGSNCYAMSLSDKLNGRTLPLSDALAVAVGFGMPSILSCLVNQLVYLEAEQSFGPPERFILQRPVSDHHPA